MTSLSLVFTQYYKHYQMDHNIIFTTILNILSSIHAEFKKVIFCWVPISHAGIPGNEPTNSVTKAALDVCTSCNSISHTDLLVLSTSIFVIYGRILVMRLMIKISFILSSIGNTRTVHRS